MPELSEIHLYARMINAECSPQIFKKVTRDAWLKHSFPTIPWSEFKIQAEARGKELRLSFTPAHPVGDTTPILVTFTHGLVGGWLWTPTSQVPNYAHLMFHSSTHMLSFVDAQKMGGWKVGSWGADRGPDPITEHAKFAKNVLKNLSKKPFEGEICELLLDQKYFNGIGNYLRAEVMYRAGISPFSVAHDVFKNTSRNLDFNSVNEASDKGLIVLYLCKKIPEEVIEQDMNKYGTEEQKARFKEWLRVYDKGVQVKKQGRTVHYATTQLMGVLKPDLGRLGSTAQPLPSSSGSSGYSSNISGYEASVNAPKPVQAFGGSSAAPERAITSIGPLIMNPGAGPLPGPWAQAAINNTSANTFSLPPQPAIVRNCEQIARESGLPPMSKLLVMTSAMERRGKLSLPEKDTIKLMILQDQPLIFSALEAFEANMDEDELVDTFKRLALLAPPTQSIDLPSVRPIAQFAPQQVVAPAPTPSATKPLPALTNTDNIQDYLIEESWAAVLQEELRKPYWSRLNAFLAEQRKKNLAYFPPDNQVFNAFALCTFSNIKVVILGQDPYHAPGQAQGLCFSVPIGVPPPPSLVNIYKELANDIPNWQRPNHGCLTAWASQGVFLLNTTLTVQQHKPMSHVGQGWEEFTSAVIQTINQRASNVVFMLWGKPAQEKGWFGQHQFSSANEYLQQHGKTPINWSL